MKRLLVILLLNYFGYSYSYEPACDLGLSEEQVRLAESVDKFVDVWVTPSFPSDLPLPSSENTEVCVALSFSVDEHLRAANIKVVGKLTDMKYARAAIGALKNFTFKEHAKYKNLVIVMTFSIK